MTYHKLRVNVESIDTLSQTKIELSIDFHNDQNNQHTPFHINLRLQLSLWRLRPLKGLPIVVSFWYKTIRKALHIGCDLLFVRLCARRSGVFIFTQLIKETSFCLVNVHWVLSIYRYTYRYVAYMFVIVVVDNLRFCSRNFKKSIWFSSIK